MAILNQDIWHLVVQKLHIDDPSVVKQVAITSRCLYGVAVPFLYHTVQLGDPVETEERPNGDLVVASRRSKKDWFTLRGIPKKTQNSNDYRNVPDFVVKLLRHSNLDLKKVTSHTRHIIVRGQVEPSTMMMLLGIMGNLKILTWRWWAEDIDADVLTTLQTRWPHARLCIEDFRVTSNVTRSAALDYSKDLDQNSRAKSYHNLLKNQMLYSLKVKVHDKVYSGLGKLHDVIVSCPNLKVFHAEPLELATHGSDYSMVPHSFKWQGQCFPELEEIVLDGYSFSDDRQSRLWCWPSIRHLHLKDTYLPYVMSTTINQIFENLDILKIDCDGKAWMRHGEWSFYRFFGQIPKLRELSLICKDRRVDPVRVINLLGDGGASLESLEFRAHGFLEQAMYEPENKPQPSTDDLAEVCRLCPKLSQLGLRIVPPASADDLLPFRLVSNSTPMNVIQNTNPSSAVAQDCDTK